MADILEAHTEQAVFSKKKVNTVIIDLKVAMLAAIHGKIAARGPEIHTQKKSQNMAALMTAPNLSLL